MAARTFASMRSTKLMPTRLNLLAGRIAEAISSAVCFTLLRQRCGVVLMLLSVSVVSTVSIICFLGCVADSFNDTTILSGALLLNCELTGRSLANIEQNHCHCRHLTQKHTDFTRGDLTVFKFRHRFHSMFARVKNSLSFFQWRRQLWRFRRTFNQPPTPSDRFFQVSAGAEPAE